MPSRKYTLSREDLTKIATGAAVAIAGALITYLTPIVSNVDWTIAGVDLTPVMVVVWSVFVNLTRKWVAGA